MKGWLSRFGTYRGGITEGAVRDWLLQFKDDADLGARVLDVIEFYDMQSIHHAYRQGLGALEGWDIRKTYRKGTWRFAAMSGSAGESGDGMLWHFRNANGLGGRVHSELFVHRSQLASCGLGKNDTVVLLDDFSGTGQQVCDAWNDPAVSYGELLAAVGKVYLILVAATNAAVNKIEDETLLTVLSTHRLDSKRDNIFSGETKGFSATDRQRLMGYCKIAWPQKPLGWGECGLVVVFHHRTPNNSIPVLHAESNEWSPIFPRHD
jgi:hypothetical protein